MGSKFQADVPGNRYFISVPVASAASNGANAKQADGVIGPFPWDVRIRAVNYVPTQGDVDVSTATSTASYRQLILYNGGTIGTITATASHIASLNLTSSLASYSSRAFGTVSTAVSMASGEMAYLSQLTKGAAHANGTVLQAGRVSVNYEII